MATFLYKKEKKLHSNHVESIFLERMKKQSILLHTLFLEFSSKLSQRVSNSIDGIGTLLDRVFNNYNPLEGRNTSKQEKAEIDFRKVPIINSGLHSPIEGRKETHRSLFQLAR